MLDLGEFAEIISKEAVAAILARRLDAAAAMRRADAAVQRLKGVRLPPPHKFTAFPCVAGARNPVASKPPAARGGVRRKLPSADQGAECTVDAVIAELRRARRATPTTVPRTAALADRAVLELLDGEAPT